MRLFDGVKLPSKHALVCVGRKTEARECSEVSGHVDGGGAAEKLHQCRKEKGSAGLSWRGEGGATLM